MPIKRQHILTATILLLLFLSACTGRDPTGNDITELPPVAAATPVASPTATIPPATPTIAPTATPPYMPVWEPAECPFPPVRGETIECGFLVVPEDRTAANEAAGEVRLAVAIIKSYSGNPQPDPLVYLAGGPGDQAVAAAGYFARLFRPVLAERDVIILDQRGTGISEPSLDCPETTALAFENIERDIPGAEANALEIEAARACRDRLLAAGINLSAYNSAASAADLDDLRRALGVDSWNLYGISYGTRLALTALRDYGHTATIRSVVLDSVAPPQANLVEETGLNFHRALSLLFARCADTSTCAATYPNLEDRFYALVDRLNASPATVTVSDPVNQEVYRIPFDGDALLEFTFRSLYSRERIMRLPLTLAALEEGNTLRVAEILVDFLHLGDSSSEGMNLSVSCVEEIPFNSPAGVAAAIVDVPESLQQFLQPAIATTFAGCELWAVEPAGPLETEPVASDIPTLILVGDYDPATPPAYARQAAEHLANAYLYEFEGLSHGVIISHACGVDIMTDFLADPDAEPDSRCLEDMYFGFVIP
jgi:pimeloyl-ACP methyl ester carboxylesterase